MRAPTPTHSSSKERGDVSYSYILMVQHLIERCLLLHMDRDDCVKTLAKYANVKPVITLTVWKELEKENKEFFLEYSQHRNDTDALNFCKALEETTQKLCAQKIGECSELLRGPCKVSDHPCKFLSP